MVLNIENRTENWKTAQKFAPFFSDADARLKLARRLNYSNTSETGDISLELYWNGIRDYLSKIDRKKEDFDDPFATSFAKLFLRLRNKIDEFGKFQSLEDFHYRVPTTKEHKRKLCNNLYYTEIDIVLESPDCLFIGEAKHESPFGTGGGNVLVHQLVRQYVTAKILVDQLSVDKKVVPFVVGDNSDNLKRRLQVQFLIEIGWLRGENVLSWDKISSLTQ